MLSILEQNLEFKKKRTRVGGRNEPVHSVSEALEEALVVLLHHPEDAIQQELPVLATKPVDVDLAAEGASAVNRLSDDPLSHAVVRRQLLQRRPHEALPLVPFFSGNAPLPEHVRRVLVAAGPVPPAAAAAAAVPSQLARHGDRPPELLPLSRWLPLLALFLYTLI